MHAGSSQQSLDLWNIGQLISEAETCLKYAFVLGYGEKCRIILLVEGFIDFEMVGVTLPMDSCPLGIVFLVCRGVGVLLLPNEHRLTDLACKVRSSCFFTKGQVLGEDMLANLGLRLKNVTVYLGRK